MGLFMQFIDSAKEQNLYGYPLFCTTLALLSFGLFLLWMKEWSIHGPTQLPIVGVESPGYFALIKARRKFASSGFRLVRDAYYKYHGKNFVAPTSRNERVVLTSRQVKELSNAPDGVVSFYHAAGATLMAKYTGLDRFLPVGYIRDALRIKLSQDLGSMREVILEETRFAIDCEFPRCTADEWTSVSVFAVILRLVARPSARAFVGLPLCRDEDWLTISIAFSAEVLKAADNVARVPKFLRSFWSYLFNPGKVLDSHKRKAESLLAPIIQKRLEEESLAEKNGTVYERPNDVLQVLLDRVTPHHRTPDCLAEIQMLICLASIHSVSLVFVNTIFDLAEHQECIQPIREEMESLISANGGVLDRMVLRKMRKTDSFCKEVSRTTVGLFNFNCMARKGLTLSDGTYLPKGTMLAAPAAIFATDPDIIEHPETFDGFRWYKRSLQVREGEVNSNGWATTSPHDLVFGHGKHACPGRFFATEELKFMLTFILLQYDFKYPEGQSRPDSVYKGEFRYPNPAQKILFKKLPGPKKFSFL
ncbi:cytochrome P450 [Tuber magnatum]|uniref:Cytochrome P450 n=1 Tax=Tuber magnatum TaxID=42249 RepID=A0A317SUA2_9PEZI|nr:cytochrome P450 [Tuber magnatum]